MLLHIRPRLLSPFKAVELLDLQISVRLLDVELDGGLEILLHGGSDLATRRPYPNKNYAVACRKKGGKRAIDGILIETLAPVEEFLYTARWSIESSFEATHIVRYTLLDHDFDAASDDMTLWYAHSPSLGGWPDRRPDWWTKHVPTLYSDAFMEVVHRESRAGTTDSFDAEDRIIIREQAFPMPTIEPGRILGRVHGFPIPPLNTAFHLP